MADASYYSDRVRGPRPRATEEIDSAAWKGILSLLDRGVVSGLFAEDFPIECDDRRGIYACNRESLIDSLQAEVPELGVPSPYIVPDTLSVLDMLEFLHRHASAAEKGKHHSFFDHYHLRFDRPAGRAQFREDVNRLLARNGLVYELGRDGRITRTTSSVVEDQLRGRLPPTRDERFDDLLETAAARYRDPDPAVRRDALEKLWDAFERSKTLLHADKKQGAAALIAEAASSNPEAEMLESELRALTLIGNKFAIRHHETRTVAPGDATVDHLFARMYALLLRLHPALR